MKLTNNARRRLGIPGRTAIILNPNQTIEISKLQYDEMQKNRTTSHWLKAGVLSVDKSSKPVKVEVNVQPEAEPEAEPDAPEGVSEEGVRLNHLGGGWYEVYVSGFKVTTHNVRKKVAEEMAAEYK